MDVRTGAEGRVCVYVCQSAGRVMSCERTQVLFCRSAGRYNAGIAVCLVMGL